MARFARISAIDNDSFVSSTAAETVSAYSATTIYILEERVRDATNHRIYVSLVGGTPATITFENVGNTVEWTAHGLAAGDTVAFEGADLALGVSENVLYYVISPTTNNFKISTTEGGAEVNFSDNGTGTQTATPHPNLGYALTDDTKWADAGPDNGRAMFDTASTVRTEFTGGTGTVVVEPDQRIDELALLDMVGVSSVLVRLHTTGASRTNLAIRSKEFDNASWTKTNVTVTADNARSPYNTITTDRLTETTANAEHYASMASASNITGSASVAVSVYAMAGTRRWLVLSTVDQAGTVRSSYFDLETGVTGTAGSGHTISIEETGVVGWYRCIVLTTQSASTGSFSMRVGMASADGVKSYTGDTANNLYVWGAQMEVGSAATPFIPTTTAEVASTEYVRYEWTYDQTDTTFEDWYSGLFTETRLHPDLWVNDLPPYASATLTVTFTGDGDMEVCYMTVGLSKEIGGMQYGAQAELNDRTSYVENDYGTIVATPRPYSQTVDGRLFIETEKADSINRLLASYRGVLGMWDLVSDPELGGEYRIVRVLGYIKRLTHVYTHPSHNEYALTVQGLVTNSTPGEITGVEGSPTWNPGATKDGGGLDPTEYTVSTDTSLAGNSTEAVTTEYAVKGYVDAAVGNTQPLDADLTALAALSSTGLVTRTGTATFATRTLTGPAAGITVTNGNGVSGNPTLALGNDLAALEALSGTNTMYYRSGADTWSAVTVSTGLSFSGGTLIATGAGSSPSTLAGQFYGSGGELQRTFGTRHIKFMQAAGSTTLSSIGINDSIIGGSTFGALATTNLRTRMNRIRYQTSASAGTQAGVGEDISTSSICITTGFYALWRWSHGLIANSGYRSFIGFADSDSPGNVNPSTLTSILGFGSDAGQSNYQFFHNDGSGTATAVDLGANFPAATNDVVYEGRIYVAPGGSTVYYSLQRFDSAQFVEGSVTTDLPAAGQFLRNLVWVNNGAIANNANIELSSFYAEAPF